MHHLRRLLEIEDSKLAWVLRLSLSGLQTQLQEALKQTPTDPGNSVCQELLQELDELLQPKLNKVSNSPTPNPSWEDIFEPIPSVITTEQKLKHIATNLIADKEVLHYIGEYQFHSNYDAKLWNEIQCLLLRVPEKIAQSWRERIITEANLLGALEDNLSLQQLPYSRNEYVYSGLKGNIQATGLYLSNKVDFHPQLMIQRGGELDVLAGVVSLCLKFIEMDTNLHHALKSVDRFGVRSLQIETEKTKYVTALIERFHRVLTTTNADPITALRARLDLDEAIHSLVYLPPSDRFSWWGKIQQEARRVLELAVAKARHAGYQVQIRPLWGIYADVYAYSKDDLQLDIGGVPAEVSACLRVYAKINDEILPGRVLFRSS